MCLPVREDRPRKRWSIDSRVESVPLQPGEVVPLGGIAHAPESGLGPHSRAGESV